MTWRNYAAGAGAIACLLSSTVAFAAETTRSANALPSAQRAVVAPTDGVRASTTLKKKSNALDGRGAIIGGVLAAAIIVGGVIIALDDDDDNQADSPG